MSEKTATAEKTEIAKQPTPAELAEARRREANDNGISLWDAPSGCLDNFDGDDDHKFRMRMLAMNDAEAGADWLGKTIEIKYWLVHEVELADMNTGEVIQTYRVVFVQPDNVAVAFVSEVVANGLRLIHRQFGRSVLDPPMRVQVKEKKTSNNRKCYVMTPVIDGKKD